MPRALPHCYQAIGGRTAQHSVHNTCCKCGASRFAAKNPGCVKVVRPARPEWESVETRHQPDGEAA